MKTDKKPPLAKSPMRLRGRRPLRPTITTTINTPLRTPGFSTKSQMKESEIRPLYNPVSCELKALAKMVEDELGAMNAKTNEFPSYASTGGGSNLLERGRFYDVYSQRRNERLRKKLSELGDEKEDDDDPKTGYNLGVKLDNTAKKKDSKKSETLKKSIMAAVAVDRSQHPRYSFRSTTKKPIDVQENITPNKAPPTSSTTRSL